MGVCLLGGIMDVLGRHRVCPNCGLVLFIIEIVENTIHKVGIPLKLIYMVAIH